VQKLWQPPPCSIIKRITEPPRKRPIIAALS
jgi:hypothetical protein